MLFDKEYTQLNFRASAYTNESVKGNKFIKIICYFTNIKKMFYALPVGTVATIMECEVKKENANI